MEVFANKFIGRSGVPKYPIQIFGIKFYNRTLRNLAAWPANLFSTSKMPGLALASAVWHQFVIGFAEYGASLSAAYQVKTTVTDQQRDPDGTKRAKTVTSFIPRCQF